MTVTGGSTARSLTGALVGAAGDQIRAVLLYGSRLLDATPDRYSAYDFVVIIEEYFQFYRDLRSHGFIHRTPSLMAAAARILPPNVISFSIILIALGFVFENKQLRESFFLYTMAVVAFSSMMYTQYLAIPLIALAVFWNWKYFFIF